MQKEKNFDAFKRTALNRNKDTEKNYFLDLIEEIKSDKPVTLEDKKKIFIDYVIEACNSFKVSVPSVSFNTIEHFSSGEDGHFHPDECKICVDEDKLKFLKMDKIKEMAYHEVTHAFMGGHDESFWNKMQKGMDEEC